MAKIWQLNDTLTLFGKETKVFDINFTSNNQSYIGLEFRFNEAIGQHMGYVSNSGGPVVYTEGGLRWIEGDTYKTVIFETEPDGELLTWLQANAVAQDQPAVTTTRVLYKGKKELTMAQFEALASLDDAVDYDITDFPNGGITNAQMTAALGYSRLFGDGEIYVCSDNGTYTKGHTYQVKVTSGVKSWEDITPESTPATGTDIQVTELPPASAENVGKIVQFMTDRNDPFLTEPKQGHWYKCQPVVADEGRYEWAKQSVQDKDYIIKTSNDIYDPYTENIGRMVYDDPDRKIVWNPMIALGELTQLVDYQGRITVNYTIGDNLNKSQEMRWDASIEGWSDAFGVGFLYIQKEARLFSSETLTKPLYAGLYLANDLVSTYPKITVTSIALADGTSITIPTGYGEAKFYNYSLDTRYSSPIDFADKYNFGSLTDADIEAFKFMAGNSVQDIKFDINKLKIQNESGLKPLKDYLGGSPLYKHELVIPYSFSVGDSETVNGSVIYHYLSNTGTQITNASEIDDNFLLSGAIGKNSAASQSESAALTWYINEYPDVSKIFEIAINFTSNNESFIRFKILEDIVGGNPITYITSDSSKTVYCCNQWQDNIGKDTSAYRTVTFETAPSGELLTWLQSNAVPQGGVDSNTVLLFNVNVTKEGSSITVEAVNASTMGYITGTVGTITDTVTQLI